MSQVYAKSVLKSNKCPRCPTCPTFSLFILKKKLSQKLFRSMIFSIILLYFYKPASGLITLNQMIINRGGVCP